MPDIEKERADFEKAEKDVREGEARIAHQTALIEELRHDGHDTGEAEKLLATLRQSLATWKSHRELIRGILEQSARRRPSNRP